MRGDVDMWNFRKCPRCGGDIFIDEDVDQAYEVCLQCGFERALERVPVARKRQTTGKDKTSAL